jgi:taurine transport system permease protein
VSTVAHAPRRARLRAAGFRLLPLAPFAGLLLVWTVGWLLARPSLATLPSVAQVAEALWSLARSGELWEHVAASFSRWGLALATAAVTGVGLGVLAGLNRVVATMLEPLATFFTAMSGIVWLPLAIVWFGIGTGMVVFVIWNSMFFVIFGNTLLGVRSVPRTLEDAVRTLGAGRVHVITRVIVPGALPHVLAGIRAGLGFGWRALIAAEIIGASAGLGAMIFSATEFLRSDVILAGNLVIGLAGLAVDLLVMAPLERRTIERWGMVTTVKGSFARRLQ